VPQIDLLLHGIPGRTNHGYLGQASAALVGGDTMVDVGSIGRRPLLETSFENVAADPGDVERVLLTHVHFDHCDNLDLFPDATVYVYEPELRRVEAGDRDWATPPDAAGVLADREVETFEDGDVLGEFEVAHTPGHTEHHVSFFLEGEVTYAFTGDAVKNTRETATLNPMVLYDTEAAVESIKLVRDRADFVVAGHDTPFYIEDGEPVASIDLDYGVNLQFSPDAATTTTVESNRSEVRGLPDEVTDATARQAFH
jgi:glyoxylase-like metal-dependent hydrolase (beta-lactamase superfamily II)